MITDPITAMKACLGQAIQGLEVDIDTGSVVIILPNGKIALSGDIEVCVEPGKLGSLQN